VDGVLGTTEGDARRFQSRYRRREAKGQHHRIQRVFNCSLPAVEGGDLPRRVRSDYREGAQADAAMMNGARCGAWDEKLVIYR